MGKIKELINKADLKTIGDYFSLFKKIKNIKEEEELEGIKKIKIAFLSSFTIKGIEEVLTVKCLKSGILPEVYLGGYNQYAQEIIKEDSLLYNFFPNLIIILIDTQALFGENYFLFHQFSDKEKKDFIGEKFNEINSLLVALSEKTSAKIIFHNFDIPYFSPLGILENKQVFGFKEALEELNKRLRDEFKENKKVFIFDYNSFCAKIGKNQLFDERMYYLADIKINLQYLPELVNEYLAYIKPLLSLSRKCLVLDLDNTLWGGIIGEDGFENIKLGPTIEGRPFLEFQKHILNLYHRGVILAVNSNNNIEDAMKVFREHPYMALKEKYFASLQINWNDKIFNIKEISKQLNIGLDSLVFIDDSKANREIIRKALPEVLVIDLPDDPALYVKTLTEINDFNTLEFTKEDKKRGELYNTQKEREDLKKKTVNIEEYLKSLETEATIEEINNFTVPRIAQLTQKTNQFNLTTRRYFLEDINNFLKSNRHFIVAVSVKDKFGENGITGLAIVEKFLDFWRIDTFLLSCRIIGREIEKIILAYIIGQANKENSKKLIGEFISTSKNSPAKDFYKNNGFKFIKRDNETDIFEYDLTNEYNYPDFIKIIKK